jgi:superfamily II DNA or RNA helicase
VREVELTQSSSMPTTKTPATTGALLQIAVTPAGGIVLHEVAGESADDRGLDAAVAEAAQLKSLRQAFAQGVPQGLLALATDSHRTALPPAWNYWKEFAARYLTALCHSPTDESQQPITIVEAPPGLIEQFVLTVPPIPGGEYLTCDVLRRIWGGLDAWVRGEISRTEGGLEAFLQDRAPSWHQLGRVCFHLAENHRDAQFPFAFMATYAAGLGKGQRVQHKPLGNALREYASARDKGTLVKLLEPVDRAAKSSGLVRELLASGDIYQPLAWTPEEALRFLREAAILDQSGVIVRLPDWWKKRSRPVVQVSIGQQRRGSGATLSLLDFDVGVALDGESLTPEEWQGLMRADDGLVLLRGKWVEVDREKLKQALDHWKKVSHDLDGQGVSFVEGMRMLAGVSHASGDEPDQLAEARSWQSVTSGEWLGQLLEQLRQPETIERARIGSDLKATLRPYQEIGVHWLWFLSRLELGACLADDMGLGKTLQVIALLLILKREKVDRPSLVVLPASLLGNWRSELQRFAPTLRAAFVHPSEAILDQFATWERSPVPFADQDLVITTYGMLYRQEWLLDQEWHVVILDEAQAIKNPSSRQTRTVKRLKSRGRITMTGTPVENRLGDLWSLFDFLCPGLLGGVKEFQTFVKNLGSEGPGRYAPLRELVRPYILRRMKTDRRIIDDLPEKTEVKAFCGLSKRQAALYAKVIDELSESLEQAEGMRRRGVVLAYLMKLKQLCNHPGHFLGSAEYPPEESGKFMRLREIVEEIASRQERVLVFTQFREMTEPLAGFLATLFGREGLVLHGGTPVAQRKKLVDDFQRESGPPFFVLSLKAGGTGLNLTAAAQVIHFDRWWNPAVENQATDRAFRIGQRRNVLVHKFICRGTLEERIDALIEEKTTLAGELIDEGGEQLLTELSNQDLLDLVTLDVRHAAE